MSESVDRSYYLKSVFKICTDARLFNFIYGRLSLSNVRKYFILTSKKRYLLRTCLFLPLFVPLRHSSIPLSDSATEHYN